MDYVTALLWAAAVCFALAFVLAVAWIALWGVWEYRMRRKLAALPQPDLGRISGYDLHIMRRYALDPLTRRPTTPPRRLAAGPYGGLCVARHYVPPAALLCHLEHSYSPAITMGAGYREKVAARDWAVRKLWVPASVPPIPRPAADTQELDRQRGAAGGW